MITATYCRDSGDLVNDACALDPRQYRAETGYFTRESVPKTKCEAHVKVLRDYTTGGIAYPTTTCSSWNCSWTALVNLDKISSVKQRSFPTEVYVVDAQYTYREMPSWGTPAYWVGVPFYRNLLKDGEYCGSSYVYRPYNSYCVEHGVWGGWTPAQSTGTGTGTSAPAADNTSGATGSTGSGETQGGTASGDGGPLEVVIDDGSLDDGFDDFMGGE